MKVWINDELLDGEQAKVSIFDHGLLYGDGVFEGIRIYGGKVFQCRAHLDRLFRSAEAVCLKIAYSKEQLAEAISETLRANDLSDGYIRLLVTRGPGTLGLNPFLCKTSTVAIITDQVQMYTDEMYDKGMGVIIANTIRTSASMLSPRVKSMNYLNNILAKIEAVRADVLEALMCNQKGNIAEATGDNVFIVKGGRILTPPPDADILLGVTRAVAIHLAGKLGIALGEENITPADVYAADECFLTGTAAEVIAVTSVDDKPIGDGKVGPVTKKLLTAFREFIRTDEQAPYTG
jgi:branched-chain amino acid aminotransferase